MEFVCLAAGRGTRFGRLGTYLQKCMYPVGLRPFVEYSVRNLVRSRGFDAAQDRLTFVVGHHAEQLRSYFGDRYAGDGYEGARDADAQDADARAPGDPDPSGDPSRALEIQFVEQPELLGTGHALHVAAQKLPHNAPVVAWLADLYVPRELFARIRAHPSENVLAVAPDPYGDNPNVAVSTTRDVVERAWQGAGPHYDIGLWKFSSAVLDAMLGRELDEFRALPSLQRVIDEGRAEVGWVEAAEWIHLGGTAPSAEENVRQVTRRLMELEPPE